MTNGKWQTLIALLLFCNLVNDRIYKIQYMFPQPFTSDKRRNELTFPFMMFSFHQRTSLNNLFFSFGYIHCAENEKNFYASFFMA